MRLMKIRYLLLLGLLACLFGCTPVDSLNPLYTGNNDTIYDEALIGTWLPVDSSQSGGMEIEGLTGSNGTDFYKITLIEKESSENGKWEFEGHLVKLGGRRFFDLVSKIWDARTDSYSLQLKSGKNQALMEPSILRLGMASYLRFSSGDGPGKLHADLIPAHWFMRITMNGSNMQFDYIDDDKFQKAIQAGKFHLQNAILNDKKDVVVTAESAELQKFIAEHAEDETLFTEHTDPLQRKP